MIHDIVIRMAFRDLGNNVMDIRVERSCLHHSDILYYYLWFTRIAIEERICGGVSHTIPSGFVCYVITGSMWDYLGTESYVKYDKFCKMKKYTTSEIQR